MGRGLNHHGYLQRTALPVYLPLALHIVHRNAKPHTVKIMHKTRQLRFVENVRVTSLIFKGSELQVDLRGPV